MIYWNHLFYKCNNDQGCGNKYGHRVRQLVARCAFAFILVSLLTGCVYSIRSTSQPTNPQKATTDSSLNSSQPSVRTSETAITIITGHNTVEQQPNMTIPQAGQIIVNQSVKTYLSFNKGNSQFFVRIYVDFFLGEAFKYQGKSITEWLCDPIFTARESIYENWYRDIYLPYDENMRAAEARGEDFARGWEKHDIGVLFEKYWSESQTPDVQNAYQQALTNLKAAKDAYSVYQVASESHDCDELLNIELLRLRDLGFDVRIEQDGRYYRGSEILGKLEGYLTADQIEDFPGNIDLYYEIEWAD
jgi:hypothetical protein